MTDDFKEEVVRAAEDKALELVRLIERMRDDTLPEGERVHSAAAAEALISGIDREGDEFAVFTHFLGVCVLLLSQSLTEGLGLSLGPRDYMEIFRGHARESRRGEPGENLKEGAEPHA